MHHSPVHVVLNGRCRSSTPRNMLYRQITRRGSEPNLRLTSRIKV